MVVCVLINRLPLIAALGGARSELMGEPVALAPEPGREQRVGEVSPAAEAFGIFAAMRVGEALSRCPSLRLVPPDPEATRGYWSHVLDRLESLGAAVESDDAGVAWFEADGLRRVHGGHLEGVLAAARRALPAGARVAAASCRFVAYAAALNVRRGRRRASDAIVPAGATRAFLAPLPVGLLRVRPGLEELPEVLERLGIRTLGQLAALPPGRIAERFGHPGLLALELLVARVLARRERRGRTLRVLALSARFVEGGTWRVSVPLRRPSADAARLRLVLAPRLGELPAPAESLAVEVEAFGPPAYDHTPLADDPGERRRVRLAEAVRHVRSAAGGEAVVRVLEIDPESRLPERRAVLAPYPEPG